MRYLNYVGNYLNESGIGGSLVGTGTGVATGNPVAAGVGAANVVAGEFKWLASALQAPRWTSDEKKFCAFYMHDITRRSDKGEDIDYTRHLPEAKTFFSLYFGKPILNRTDAIKAFGMTDDGNVFAQGQKMFPNGLDPFPTFAKYGLPLPKRSHLVNGTWNDFVDYTQVVNSITNGSFFTNQQFNITPPATVVSGTNPTITVNTGTGTGNLVNSGTGAIPGTPASTTPKWVVPVAIGGGILIVGLLTMLIIRKK